MQDVIYFYFIFITKSSELWELPFTSATFFQTLADSPVILKEKLSHCLS